MPGAAGPLYLASTSPRRRDLLRAAGLLFEVLDPGVGEDVAGGDPVAAAVALAERKARSVAARVHAGCVIGADTIVWAGDRRFGKPADREDARRILRALSGGTHRVTTGYAVVRVRPFALRTGHDTASVTMRTLSPSEIDGFVATGEADDKAGAYGIQGPAAAFVARLDGSLDTVVGLPVGAVLAALAGLGFAGLPGAGGPDRE
jgi:septum formation protein